jgi:hypothetical protein
MPAGTSVSIALGIGLVWLTEFFALTPTSLEQYTTKGLSG